MRYSLGLVLSPTHLTAAVYDRELEYFCYCAHQPRELAQLVIVEVQRLFGAVRVFEAHQPQPNQHATQA